jgi:MoxR-like ATPase
MSSMRDTTNFSFQGSIATVQRAASVAVAAGVPTILWGGPGVGKTTWVRAFAKANGFHLERVITSIREPTDFSGLPVVGSDGYVRFAPPNWAVRLAEKGEGVLFFDEISNAPPAVQAAVLDVVLERVVGDIEIGEGVRILAAANPPKSAACGWDLAPPLANRFCHLKWPFDEAAVIQGTYSGWPEPEVVRLPAGWEAGIPSQSALTAAFREAVSGHGYREPTERSAAGLAWPSPRTWDFAARLLAACEAAGVDHEVADLLVAGCVGEATGTEFSAWLEDQDIPKVSEVLANPDGFAVPDRADKAYVLARTLVARATEPTVASKKVWAASWKALERIAQNAGADTVVPAAQTLIRYPNYIEHGTPKEVTSLTDVMCQAGMM